MEGNSIDDDDDGFDTEEFDSSDNNDETPPKPHSQTEYSPKTQAEVRLLYYFSFNLLQILGDGKKNTFKPSQVEEGRNFNASHHL